MSQQEDPRGRRGSAPRDRWRILTPLALMVTPAAHLLLGADGGYFWFYLGLLLLFAAYLLVALLRPGRLGTGRS